MTKRAAPAKAWAAYQDGHAGVREWLGTLPDAQWSGASVLPGWAVIDLAAHFASVAGSISAVAPALRGTAPKTLAEYITGYAPVADVLADAARRLAAESGHEPEAILALIDKSTAAAGAHIERIGFADQVVLARRGPIQLGDFLVTRVLEVVVHADDLARSVPGEPPPRLPRDAVRLTVRALLDALAERAPGRSVEVRVPPHAAVQCVEGPRHVRGTPPNMVEMDATTWLRLASGRLSWMAARAEGLVSASGERADLTPYLPLL